MSKQPKSLELAQALDVQVEIGGGDLDELAVAAERLRSQHQLIGELVEVVESLMHWPIEPATSADGCYSDDPVEIRVRAVLSKAAALQAPGAAPGEPT